MYFINWTLTAELTYHKEIEFILKKWSYDEVEKFIKLVEDKIQVLSSGTMTGTSSSIKGVRVLVISKQTSLAYTVLENQSRIELLSFWNNQSNPEDYKEYLEI
ncbi:hypothetical protein SCB49_06257 [unidentified eubacterium SCB49]|nr:hypothetical protein SCB49_06257 [unidentified eubacterium SCB49]